MITLKHLRYFEALSRHLHFGKAASDCAVSQPALSMQVQELERLLGVQLVERRPGSVALTTSGEEIAQRARSVLAAVRDLSDHARQAGGCLSGTLALGVIPSVAPYLLPAALPLLHSTYPDLDLTLRETQTRHLLEALDAGGLDVALLSVPLDSDAFETRALFDDAFVFVAPEADGMLRPEQRVTPAVFENVGLLLLEEGHCLRDQALDYCDIARPDLRSRYGATSLTTIMQMVANGYGATLLPEIAVPVELGRNANVRLSRFEDPEPKRTIGLAWRRSSPRRADVEALAEILKRAGEAVIGEARAIV